jgi:hypothetical protein
MQYRPGKSIVRLIAAQGIPKTVTLAQAVGTRIEGLRAVVKDFTEVSRREFTLLNTPAIESIQTFVLENVGDFHTKEVTLIHKGTYYLILCQCISPDTYEDLESDFDKIIESFGFMQ